MECLPDELSARHVLVPVDGILDPHVLRLDLHRRHFRLRRRRTGSRPLLAGKDKWQRRQDAFRAGGQVPVPMSRVLVFLAATSSSSPTIVPTSCATTAVWFPPAAISVVPVPLPVPAATSAIPSAISRTPTAAPVPIVGPTSAGALATSGSVREVVGDSVSVVVVVVIVVVAVSAETSEDILQGRGVPLCPASGA